MPKKDKHSFDPDCKTAFSGDTETIWDSPGRFQHVKTNAKENILDFLVLWFLFLPTDMSYIFPGTSSWFTLALCHLLQSSCYHSSREIVIPASTFIFCVHVIIASSLVLKCWIIPAVILHSKESSWKNISEDDCDSGEMMMMMI